MIKEIEWIDLFITCKELFDKLTESIGVYNWKDFDKIINIFLQK